MKKLLTAMLFSFIVFIIQAPQIFAFSDVKKGASYEKALKWAVEQKIVSGYPDGTFKPNKKVTHSQFIKMYVNTYNFEKNNPKTSNDFYKVIEPYHLKFDDYEKRTNITRGEVSALMAYAAGKLPNYERNERLYMYYDEAASFMLDSKLSSGQNTGENDKEIFGSENQLTRAQAVVFLYRASQLGYTKLAKEIQYILKPPVFDRHDEVLRSYNMGDGIVYYVIDRENLYMNYEVVVTMNEEVLGGYIAIPNANVYGYTIGELYKNQIYKTNYFEIDPQIDIHNKNEIRAVIYRFKNENYAEKTAKAMLLYDVKDIDQVALVYTDLVNEFRVKNGRSLLQMHPVLTKAAKSHSIDMAQRNYFSHRTPENLSPGDRIKLVGTIPNLYGWGENISAGRDSVFKSHTSWIQSFGHRENMLEPGHTHVGYGVALNSKSEYRTYFTTKFGMVRQ